MEIYEPVYIYHVILSQSCPVPTLAITIGEIRQNLQLVIISIALYW